MLSLRPSHGGRLLQLGLILEGLRRLAKEFDTQVLMRDLSTPEHDGQLDLGAFVEQLLHHPALRRHVVVANAGPEPDLAQQVHLLCLAALALLLGLYVAELPVVEQAAHGRLGRRGYLHEIQASFLCKLDSLERGHSAKLLALLVDDKHLRHSDSLVDPVVPWYALPPTVDSRNIDAEYSTPLRRKSIVRSQFHLQV